MYIELLDALRCPQPHEESWLVAAFDRADGRVILDGRLGCHACGAEYEIRDGVADFGGPPRQVLASTAGAPDPWRTGALLDLRTPDMLAVLAGEACRAVPALLELLPARIIAVNPPSKLDPRDRLGVVIADTNILPLRSLVATGVALGAGEEHLLNEAVRVLRAGGRLMAPAGAPVPAGLREVARDSTDYAAVKEDTSTLVQIGRLLSDPAAS